MALDWNPQGIDQEEDQEIHESEQFWRKLLKRGKHRMK